MHRPVTKELIFYVFTYEALKNCQIDKEKYKAGCQGLEGENGELLLMGIEFQFCKIEFWRCNVNALNTSELYP